MSEICPAPPPAEAYCVVFKKKQPPLNIQFLISLTEMYF